MNELRGHPEIAEQSVLTRSRALPPFRPAPSRRALRILLGAFCVPALIFLPTGCANAPNPALAGPTYPESQQGPTLDIQVVRDDTRIRLTNTTVKSYTNARLWVNRWYSKPVEKFDVGQTLELSLWDFRDEYGESFEAGGFFATRKPDRLVQAQLQVGDVLYGLVVVGRQDDLN